MQLLDSITRFHRASVDMEAEITRVYTSKTRYVWLAVLLVTGLNDEEDSLSVTSTMYTFADAAELNKWLKKMGFMNYAEFSDGETTELQEEIARQMMRDDVEREELYEEPAPMEAFPMEAFPTIDIEPPTPAELYVMANDAAVGGEIIKQRKNKYGKNPNTGTNDVDNGSGE